MKWNQGKWWKFESSCFVIGPRYTFRQFQAPPIIPVEKLIDGSAAITSETNVFDFKAAPMGYFLMDISWRFKWCNFAGVVSVTNLFDTSYRDYLNQMRYFADETGINVLFTLNYSFKKKKNS